MCIFNDDGTGATILLEDAVGDGGPVGYRSFRVETDGYGRLMALHSPQQSAAWTAEPVGDGSGRWIIDGSGRHLPTCRRTGAPEGRTAGFYVVDDPSSDAIVSGPGLAVFRVRPFGTVVRHEQPGGYRAESLVVEGIAYPVMPDDVAAELAHLPEETRARLMSGMGRRVDRPRPTDAALALFESFAAPLPAEAVREGLKHRLSEIARGDRGYGREVPVYIVVSEDVRDSCRILSDVPHRHPDARDRGRVFTDKVARHIGRPAGTSMEWTTREARDATVAEWSAIVSSLGMAESAHLEYPLPAAFTVDPAVLERLARETRREVGAESRRLHAADRRHKRIADMLVRMLRTDPAACAQYARNLPADDRKRAGITRHSDGPGFTFRAPDTVRGIVDGAGWPYGNRETIAYGRWELRPYDGHPDAAPAWRLESTSRGQYVTVRARWTAETGWQAPGRSYRETVSAGWSGNRREAAAGATLVLLLGKHRSWKIVNYPNDYTTGYDPDTRAIVTNDDAARLARRIERARRLEREAVDAL